MADDNSSPGNPTPDEFLHVSKFKVEIDGAGITTYFHEVEGLQAQIEVVEYQEGGENTKTYKLPGQTRFSNIVLRRGVTNSVDMFNWIKDAVQGNVKRASGAIHVLNSAGDPVVTFKFVEGWPCRYKGPDLDSQTDELSIEVLEIAHEGLEMVQGG